MGFLGVVLWVTKDGTDILYVGGVVLGELEFSFSSDRRVVGCEFGSHGRVVAHLGDESVEVVNKSLCFVCIVFFCDKEKSTSVCFLDRCEELVVVVVCFDLEEPFAEGL